MTPMRRLPALLALVFAMAACGHAPSQEPGLSEIVRRHVKARGGAAALDAMRQIRINVDITERGQPIHARYAADAGGLVRVDIYADGELAFREGVDAKGAWLWPGGEPQPREGSAAGKNALLNGAEMHLFGLHRYEERGHALSLMPRQTIDGVAYYVIRSAFRTGQTSYFYVDPETWLIVRRRDERAYHPDVDPTEQKIETQFSDIRSVEGVLISYETVDRDLVTNEVMSSQSVEAIAINSGLTAAQFDRHHATPARLP
jgi:hypothetical protein